MSSVETAAKPTVEELLGFLSAQKELEKKTEEKRQCLLAGREYQEEEQRGARRLKRAATLNQKHAASYEKMDARSRALAVRAATKKAIPRGVLSEMCRRTGSTTSQKTEKSEEEEPRGGPVEKENKAVEQSEQTRKSGRARKARTPFDMAP